MFIAIARPAVEPQGPDAVAVPGSPAIAFLTPRALHARLLENAATRRRRGVERKLAAVWTAVERACEREDFRPNPSRLCDWCGFKSYCPSFGGDIALADAHRLQEFLHERSFTTWNADSGWLPATTVPAVPPADRVKAVVVRFDDAVDTRVDRLRGHPVLDRVMYAASELGDWALIWHLIGAGQGLLPGRDPRSAVRLSVILGAESLLPWSAVFALSLVVAWEALSVAYAPLPAPLGFHGFAEDADAVPHHGGDADDAGGVERSAADSVDVVAVEGRQPQARGDPRREATLEVDEQVGIQVRQLEETEFRGHHQGGVGL